MQSIVIKAMSHSCSILISKLLMLAYLDDINDDDDILCKAYIIYKLMNQCKMPHLIVSQTSHSETISELVTCQDGGDLRIEFLWYWSNPGSLLILASYMFESPQYVHAAFVVAQSLSQATLCDPMDTPHQATLSMGLSRQEY